MTRAIRAVDVYKHALGSREDCWGVAILAGSVTNSAPPGIAVAMNITRVKRDHRCQTRVELGWHICVTSTCTAVQLPLSNNLKRVFPRCHAVKRWQFVHLVA